jgi:hypothetical protein
MSAEPTITTLSIEGDSDVSLLDILDHVLNAGVIIHGNVVISLAGVDLVYVGLTLIVTSVETALRHIEPMDAPSTPQKRRVTR